MLFETNMLYMYFMFVVFISSDRRGVGQKNNDNNNDDNNKCLRAPLVTRLRLLALTASVAVACVRVLIIVRV